MSSNERPDMSGSGCDNISCRRCQGDGVDPEDIDGPEKVCPRCHGSGIDDGEIDDEPDMSEFV